MQTSCYTPLLTKTRSLIVVMPRDNLRVSWHLSYGAAILMEDKSVVPGLALQVICSNDQPTERAQLP